MRLLSIVILIIATMAPASAQPVQSVPYHVGYNGWFTVEVMVNGQGPYDFIIDTGATQSLVFQSLADEIDFISTGGTPQTVLGLAAQGAFPPYLIGELAVGEAKLGGLISVILPDWGVETRPYGIIGLDFLRQYIVVFDAEAGLIHFYDRDAPPPGDAVNNWKRAELTPDNFGLESNYLYTVKGFVNSRRVTFLVDLGASGTLINRSGIAAVVKTGYSIRLRPSGGDARERITDALNRSQETRSVKVNRFKIGRNYWYRVILAIHDSPIFSELGVQSEPFGLFGADLVRDRSFLLDFEGGEMLIGKRYRNSPALQPRPEKQDNNPSDVSN